MLLSTYFRIRITSMKSVNRDVLYLVLFCNLNFIGHLSLIYVHMLFYVYLIYIMCSILMCLCFCVPWYTCGGQWTACRSLFPSSHRVDPGNQTETSGLQQSPLHTEPSCWLLSPLTPGWQSLRCDSWGLCYLWWKLQIFFISFLMNNCLEEE